MLYPAKKFFLCYIGRFLDKVSKLQDFESERVFVSRKFVCNTKYFCFNMI